MRNENYPLRSMETDYYSNLVFGICEIIIIETLGYVSTLYKTFLTPMSFIIHVSYMIMYIFLSFLTPIFLKNK